MSGRRVASEAVSALLCEMTRRGACNPFDIDPKSAPEAYHMGWIEPWQAGRWTLTASGEVAAGRAALKESTNG